MIERFCDGGVDFENVGQHTRVTWHTQRGDARVPVVSLVVPSRSLRELAAKFAAAELLTPDDDHMGDPVGNA